MCGRIPRKPLTPPIYCEIFIHTYAFSLLQTHKRKHPNHLPTQTRTHIKQRQTQSTCYDSAGHTGDPGYLGEVTLSEVVVAGRVELLALAEMLPQPRGLLHGILAGVTGRRHGAVFCSED